PDENTVSIALNETTTLNDLNNIIAVFAQASAQNPIQVEQTDRDLLADSPMARQTEYLTHEVFNSYRSETELMRYIKSLERKDLSLTHSMIALGSCTMKLNAASEMLSLSNPQWGNIHPFVHVEQAQGYQKMLGRMEEQLSIKTGLAATSLKPN